MSFKEDFGSLTPPQLLLGLRSVLGTYDQDDGELAMEDQTAQAAAIYVLCRAAEHLMAKELESNADST